MNHRKIKFEELNPSDLKFARPCKHGHVGPDNQGVRFRSVKGTYHAGECVACAFKLPPGPFGHQFTGDIEPGRVFLTEEESRLRHIQQVMDYQKRKPEGQRIRQQRYWDNLSEEKKAEKSAKTLARYHANKEKVRAQVKARYYRMKALKDAAKENNEHTGS